MKSLLSAASMAVLCAAPALAAEDVMAGFYGNTAVSTGGSIEIHTHYRADHTFDFVGLVRAVYVQGTLLAGSFAADHAAATAQRIAQNEMTFRLAMLADIATGLL